MLASVHTTVVRVRSAAVKANSGDFFPDDGERPIGHRDLRVVPLLAGPLEGYVQETDIFALQHGLLFTGQFILFATNISFVPRDMRDERAFSWRLLYLCV